MMAEIDWQELKDKSWGMTTSTILRLINKYVSSFSGGLYLEIGVFRGCTLIGALLGNDAVAVGVDDFSQFDGTQGILIENLVRWGVQNRVVFLQMSAKEFFASCALRVNACFYDGDHAYASELYGLENCYQCLVPGGYMFIDDTKELQVQHAVKQFLMYHPNMTVIEDHPVEKVGDEHWWFGFIVLRKGL